MLEANYLTHFLKHDNPAQEDYAVQIWRNCRIKGQQNGEITNKSYTMSCHIIPIPVWATKNCANHH
jgi:hypothetical protein